MGGSLAHVTTGAVNVRQFLRVHSCRQDEEYCIFDGSNTRTYKRWKKKRDKADRLSSRE
jgi:hypothetical protein